MPFLAFDLESFSFLSSSNEVLSKLRSTSLLMNEGNDIYNFSALS